MYVIHNMNMSYSQINSSRLAMSRCQAYRACCLIPENIYEQIDILHKYILQFDREKNVHIDGHMSVDRWKDEHEDRQRGKR